MKKLISVCLLLIVIVVGIGCQGSNNTIQTCIVANESYTQKENLEKAKQENTLPIDTDVFASIHFVESPKGMEYTVIWYVDENEVKSETKATQGDSQDIVVYELEGSLMTKGTLKLEVKYEDTVLMTKEFAIE